MQWGLSGEDRPLGGGGGELHPLAGALNTPVFPDTNQLQGHACLNSCTETPFPASSTNPVHVLTQYNSPPFSCLSDKVAVQVFWGLDTGVRWDITFTTVVSYKERSGS